MTDIVDRLREHEITICQEAADEIDTLRFRLIAIEGDLNAADRHIRNAKLRAEG